MNNTQAASRPLFTCGPQQTLDFPSAQPQTDTEGKQNLSLSLITTLFFSKQVLAFLDTDYSAASTLTHRRDE